MTMKVLDIDLAEGLADRYDARPHARAMVLVRWRGEPIGRLVVAAPGGWVAGADLVEEACGRFRGDIVVRMVRDLVGDARGPAAEGAAEPSCTIAICTRDRPDDLARCLAWLKAGRLAPLEILVVDNAPSDERTAEVCQGHGVRYVREPMKGLNRARTRAAEEARGEIIAFIDDDAAADPGWLQAMLRPFREPGVAAVTGLVMPLELETDAQERFEAYSGFCRGFRRRDFTIDTWPPAAAGVAGVGASMAFRRDLVVACGLFRCALDAGTPTQSGGDTYAFFRLLRMGRRIVYTPEAVAWHRHRRTEAELRAVLYGYSVGTYAFLLRCLLVHGDLGAVAVGAPWFCKHHLRQLWRGLRGKSDAQPLALTCAELAGVAAAPAAYWKSRRSERREPEAELRLALAGRGGQA